MSLKNKFFSLITLAFSIVALTIFALGQETTTGTVTPDKAEKHKRGEGRGFGKRKMGHEGRGKRHGGFGLRGIELTEAQKGQIKSIREANKPDAAVMEEMKAIRQARKAGTELTVAQKDRMKAMHEQFRAKRQSVHEQMMAVLTPEQKTQLEQRKAEMKQRRQEMKQKFQERRKQRQQTTTETPKDN